MKNLLAIYGSLRRDCGNFLRFKDGLNYLGTTEINGFKMYSLGPYPACQRSDNEKDKVVVEIFEVDKITRMTIDGMEYGAGYKKENIDVNLNGETLTCGIYVYPKNFEFNEDIYFRVVNGDWVNRELSKSKKPNNNPTSRESQAFENDEDMLVEEGGDPVNRIVSRRRNVTLRGGHIGNVDERGVVSRIRNVISNDEASEQLPL